MNNYKYNPIKMTPFKWFVLENFPFIEEDFDSLTSYGLWCKLKEYFNKVATKTNEMGTQVENLTNAFNVLKDYVDNYFDNLDVQDEINNKLDDMVERGTLQEIISSYLNSKAIFGFDNVASMKQSSNLINGSYAKTLGYYNKNDGGEGLYKIRNRTFNDVIDNGFIILMSNENLVAELIIDKEININTLGAKNDESEDCSTIFNNAFNYINNRFINDNDFTVNTVLCSGKYLIEHTIEIPPFAQLKSTGFTTFRFNHINDNVAFFIHYLNNQVPTFPTGKQQFNHKSIFNFEKGCLILSNNNLQNTAIEIGERSNVLNNMVSRFDFENISIQNFDIGILLNSYNVFIPYFNKCHIEYNNINVQFGHNNEPRINSGEHIVFNECILAGATNYCFKWETTGFDLEVTNSSIDYNNYILGDPFLKGYHVIDINSCHIEHNNHLAGAFGFFTDIFLNNIKLYVVIDDNSNDFELITKKDAINDASNIVSTDLRCPKISFNNIYTIEMVLNQAISPEKLCEVCYMNISYNNYWSQLSTTKSFVKNGNILQDLFDSLEDGEITVNQNSNFGFNNFMHCDLRNYFKTNCRIETDNFLYQGHKSLVFKKESNVANNVNFNCTTDFIPVRKKEYYANVYTYNKTRGNSIMFSFYDINKNLISTSESAINSTNKPTELNKWWISNIGRRVIVPENCAYFKVTYNMGNWNGSEAQTEDTEYKIGGFIIN